jgi:hypothetical protein
MTETAQIIIITVITILTIVISFVGFQAFMLLKDLRESVRQTNGILSDVDNITSKLSQSTDSVSGMFGGMKAVISLIGAIKKVRGTDEQ